MSWQERYEQWRQAYADALPGEAASPGATTLSGIPRDALYGPPAHQVDRDRIGFPGQPPFTRGVYPTMYRGRRWTIRQFAGFADADDTNRRLRELVDGGQDGLSVAFDMPTLMGIDSDDPRSLGEVGHCGVAVDTVGDVERLFDGLPLGELTTSMTINGPAVVLFAMYVVAAERQGVARSELGGTLQADIFKEYIAQKEWLFPPRPHLRVIGDLMVFCADEMPRYHPVSVSGYHIREAGATAVQELAYTLADGFAYVELGLNRGLDPDAFVPRLSFFFDAHIDFFEEIAKFRAARRIWSNWLEERYGITSAHARRLRFHTQTAGVSLTAQQPDNNVVRTTVEALAAVLGGTQSLHTNALDEVLALPTDRAARIALRTQQVLAEETGVADVIDPLGGSWYVEALTDELERRTVDELTRIRDLGDGSMTEGVLSGIEQGSFTAAIAESAFAFQNRLDKGLTRIVGVNVHVDEDDHGDLDTLRIAEEVAERQCERLARVRAERDPARVAAALDRVVEAARSERDIVEPVIEAVRVDATLGELTRALQQVWGRYHEPAAI